MPNQRTESISSEFVVSVPQPCGTQDVGKENLRLKKTVKRLRDKQRNTKKREDRLRKTVKCLISDLHQANKINSALKAQLEDMKGK